MYQPIFQVECMECDATPTVGVQHEKGFLEATKLCGRCFFNDRAMLDYTLWNNQPDSTE
jgi:hypothetical protein